MESANVTKVDTNSGVAKWRGLLCAFTLNKGPASEFADLSPTDRFFQTSTGIPDGICDSGWWRMDR
jgi:hypothetical protein